MTMTKIVKKWGDSLIITFTREEKQIMDLVEGDYIDLEVRDIQTKEPIK